MFLRDHFWDYDKGLAVLGAVLTAPQDQAALGSLSTAFRDNFDEEHKFSSTPALRMARVALIRRLNQLALDHLQRSFLEICFDITTPGPWQASLNATFVRLRSLLPADEPQVLLDVLDLEYRLWSVIGLEVHYGVNDRTRREKAEVLVALDAISQAYGRQRFTDWLLALGTGSFAMLSSDKPLEEIAKNDVMEPLPSRLLYDYKTWTEALKAQTMDDMHRGRLDQLATALLRNVQEATTHGDSEESQNERWHLLLDLDMLSKELGGPSYAKWCGDANIFRPTAKS